MKPKVSWFIENNMPVRGVVHVGAGDGEEIPGYRELGIKNILCFEPLGPAFATLVNNYPIVHSYKIALGDKNEKRTLHVSAGDGKGSSMLDVILDHPEVVEKWNHGQAEIVEHIEIQVRRFDSWYKDLSEKRIAPQLNKYNCIVLDTQGNEFEVIEGFGEYINNFDYLMVELSEVPVYVGEHSAAQVCEQLEDLGFERLTPIYPHDDVMFRRVK